MAMVDDADIVKEITQAIAERKQSIEANNARLVELNALISTQDEETKAIDELIQYLTEFPAIFKDANFDQKRAALRKIVHSVYYNSDKKQVTINLIGSNNPISVYLDDESRMRS